MHSRFAFLAAFLLFLAAMIWTLIPRPAAPEKLKAQQAIHAALTLREIKLRLPPAEVDDEASGLLPIQNRAFLGDARSLGFWVILDELPVEQSIARLERHPSAKGKKMKWEIHAVHARVKGDFAGATSDCEAIARRGDFVYILGSHFGSKEGPLEDRRQFIARFEDRASSPQTSAGAAREDADSPGIQLEIALDHFLLHRLINDAFTSTGLELIERGPAEYERYIRKMLAKKKMKTGGQRILSGDRAINIEGAAFLESGALLLGLRYPVTRQGHPILVEVGGAEKLFTGGIPRIEGLWTLENVGAAGRPEGIRDLIRRGARLDVLTGNLDRYSAAKGESGILEDHPEGIAAYSRHYSFSWPVAPPGPQNLRAELVRDLAPNRNAEGLAVGPDGLFYYAFDENRVRIQYEE